MKNGAHQTIPIERPAAAYRQIADYFVRELTNGNLAENDRIPPTTELAKMFQVTPVTVQQGLKLLTRRGILQRTPGRGTFVRRGFAQRTVGFIFGREVFSSAGKLFHGAVLEQLIGLCLAHGWNYRLYPTAEFNDDGRGFRELKTAVDDGILGAVIEFCTNDAVADYLKNECPAPVNNANVPLDYPDLFAQGIGYLQRRGATRILVLSRGDFPHPEVIFPPGTENLPVPWAACAGTADADRFFGLLREALVRKPDGVLVSMDTMLQPAIIAILQAGLRIPEDVKLITHANKGRDYFFNVPLTRLELDPAEYAAEIWKQLSATLDGRIYTSPPLKVKLAEGKTCGE